MKWIKVTDTIPDGIETVIVYDKHEGVTTGYLNINNTWFINNDGYESFSDGVEITHWMPLPSKPEEES